jgi:hypothetical protein
VQFPGSARKVPGCLVERPDRISLVVTVPGGVVECVVSSIDALPKETDKAFPISVSWLGSCGFTVEECVLTSHERGLSEADIAERDQAWIDRCGEEVPHVFSFRCTSQE